MHASRLALYLSLVLGVVVGPVAGEPPTTHLKATLRVPPSESVPELLFLDVKPVPHTTGTEELEKLEQIECPVTNGSVTCDIPAGAFDLKLHASGFVPHYFWNTETSSTESLDLGVLEMRRAASVVGWVLAPDGRPFEEQLQVELAPAFLGGGIERFPEAERRTQVTASTRTTERGFFQFDDVDLGEYVVRVEGPEGYSPATRSEVRVQEAREHVLEGPLIPNPLAELQVVIDPPQAPDSSDWRIVLHRRIPFGSASRRIAEESAAPDGTWDTRGLEAGVYRVGLEDSSGSRFAEKEIEIETGLSTVRFELPFVAVEGWLRAGTEPIHARLELSGLDGTVVRLPTDEEGRFRGVVPREGDWQAKVVPLEGRGSQFLRRLVHVARSPGEKTTHLDIVLPGTSLEGRVLDLDGEPVEKALVSLFGTDRTALGQRYTDADGRFHIVGLEPGEVKLRGESRDGGDSGFVDVELDEDKPTDVDLELAQARTMEFRVVDAFRTTAGAVVRLLDPNSAFGQSVTSGPLGTFELRIPPGTRRLSAVILAPGAAVTFREVDLPRTGSGPIDLTVAESGGRLRFPPSQTLYLGQTDLLPLHQFLRPFTGPHLREFDRQAGLMTLEVASGEWTLCPSPDRSDRCASGYLAPGGVLDLNPRIEGRSSSSTPRTRVR